MCLVVASSFSLFLKLLLIPLIQEMLHVLDFVLNLPLERPWNRPIAWCRLVVHKVGQLWVGTVADIGNAPPSESTSQPTYPFHEIGSVPTDTSRISREKDQQRMRKIGRRRICRAIINGDTIRRPTSNFNHWFPQLRHAWMVA